LAESRAAIDALDHQLLDLMARRNAIVAEIAAYKRANATPIRDFARERELLGDRRSYAGRLGLSPEIVESVFRLLLWASRDRQAALKAEVPTDVVPRTVAIIGGRGGMGQCLTQMFSDLGHVVLVADLHTPLTPQQAAADADVVVISVPIEATEQVIRELGPRVRPDGLLMDVTSVKTGPLAAMLAATPAAVVGTHPLFGPNVHSLQGQRIVLTRGRGDAWFDWAYRMFHARGLAIVETTAAEHDRMMAIVQVLAHFSTEVMGLAMAELGAPLARTLELTSPIYFIKLLLTARHFGQSAELYANIEMANPDTAHVTQAFVDAARRIAELVARGDRPAFEAMFTQVHDYFGHFTEEALETSSYLIDRVVERA
jgi:chorismate mutase/prephenate dehydrogenase